MVTALFRKTGTYFGDDIMASSISNPYGYYECFKINNLNNRIIQRMLNGRFPHQVQKVLRKIKPPIHKDPRCSMLAAPKHIRTFKLSDEMVSEIRHFVSHTPFCLKDPRFSITLPFWKPFIPDNTCHIVAFRDPRRTVDSMLRNNKDIYNSSLPIDENWGFKLWNRNYGRLLNEISDERDWFFVHDETIFDRTAIPALEKFVETNLATDQVNPQIRRSHPERFETLDNQHYFQCKILFEQLKERSKQDIEKWLD